MKTKMNKEIQEDRRKNTANTNLHGLVTGILPKARMK